MIKANEGLLKMTELCRALQEERKQMLKELKGGVTLGKENKDPVVLTPTKLEPTVPSSAPQASLPSGEVKQEQQKNCILLSYNKSVSFVQTGYLTQFRCKYSSPVTWKLIISVVSYNVFQELQCVQCAMHQISILS